MPQHLQFQDVSCLADSRDNVAIAKFILAPGSTIRAGEELWKVPYTILEGHRFAVRKILKGDSLLSWGLPFGKATQSIHPGEYICNDRMLEALPAMGMSDGLPSTGNFTDERIDFQLDEHHFSPGTQVEFFPNNRTFDGYGRPGGRGVGTRNTLVVLGTSSRTGAFVREIARRFENPLPMFPNIDDISAVAHTEGGMAHTPHNQRRILATLAGFFVHPNVGAIVCVDYGDEPVNNQALQQYLQDTSYPWQDVPHQFISLRECRGDPLDVISSGLEALLPAANDFQRAPHPLTHLKIALQCGGSDAFSGISANPLVGWVSRELIRHGGSACIAETTELIGAEPHILGNVRDLKTARQYLQAIEDFRELAGWHGHTPEGNPSGGNRYRGLYNIIVKSIGAAMKKAPDVRLDYAIEYSQLMKQPGYFFMDSPGNDLESIAGQVAAGCNLIFFTTGNGSITNFPFVPTIKVVTTTGRYQLLKNEMDVNAGDYLDSGSMEDLGRKTFQTTLDVAGGLRTAGERAGHSQVQIWRNWEQNGSESPRTIERNEHFPGIPVPPRKGTTIPIQRPSDQAQVRLILPNSLCSGQVANMLAQKLQKESGQRYVALPHTEGCGCHAADSGDLAARTLLHYVLHPIVSSTLFLEHGCEKYQNLFFQDLLEKEGEDKDHFGWASIQKDGGIRSVATHVQAWFARSKPNRQQPLPPLRTAIDIGLYSSTSVPDEVAATLSTLCRSITESGGTVVIPASSTLLASHAFLMDLLDASPLTPTLAYGDRPHLPGFHIMDVPTHDDLDIISGLGASGAEVMAAYVGSQAIQAHPLVPVIQWGGKSSGEIQNIDFRLRKAEPVHESTVRLYNLISDTFSGKYLPKMMEKGLVAFQLSRGRLGISL